MSYLLNLIFGNMALKEQMERQGNWLFRYRGMLPLILVVFAGGVYVWGEMRSDEILLKQEPYRYIYEMFCLLVGLLGLGIRMFTVGYTPRNTSGRNTSEGQVADQLNTTGIYSLVRNPLYLGNFFMWLGLAMLTMNFWFIISFVLFYWIYYERIIFAEEQFLIGKFGEQYMLWADRTPCFIPKLTGYVKPAYPFSWKKVIKKEKNGLFALLLLFCAFDVGGQLLHGQPPKYMWLVYATAFVALIYLALKIVKHNTKWLDEEGR